MDIEQIKADREAGTPGPFVCPEKYPSEVEDSDGLTVASCWHEKAVGVTINLVGVRPCSLEESRANARRFTRVPDLEAAVIAQDALIKEIVSILEKPVLSEYNWHGYEREQIDAILAKAKVTQ